MVDFADGHLAGVEGDVSTVEAGVVVTDVFTNPVQVGFFGAGRILFDAKLVPVLIEKFFLCHHFFHPWQVMLYYQNWLGYFTCFGL